MLNTLAVLFYLAVAFFLYYTILKKREPIGLPKKAFVLTFLRGLLPCTVGIIVFELSFDRFVFQSTGSLGGELLTSFLRAALIEETFKFLGSFFAVRKHAPATKVETMLLCGMIGAGFGLIEKIAYGGGIILMVNAVLPLHIFFQFLMGAFLFEARKAGENGDLARKRKTGFLAFFLPFLVHGCWDALLSVAGWLMEREGSELLPVLGLLMFLLLTVGGIVAEVKIVKKMIRM